MYAVQAVWTEKAGDGRVGPWCTTGVGIGAGIMFYLLRCCKTLAILAEAAVNGLVNGLKACVLGLASSRVHVRGNCLVIHASITTVLVILVKREVLRQLPRRLHGLDDCKRR